MTSLKELHDFKVQFCSRGFEITQLKSMNELVQLGVSQLDSVKTREEAYGAGLRNKEHLEELRLSWNDTFSENKSVSDTRSESSVNMAREVIEGLEPHMDLKHLHISGYNGPTSPTWLAKNVSVTSLQTLHLDGCGGWKILPSLESLPLLTKLKLGRMWEVIEVLVPSLQELVLVEMPKLERCSCSSVGGMSSSLRELQIKDCQALEEFDLFENNNKFEIKQRSWLPSLRKLILCDCPQLKVLKSLPPSAICSELLISGVSMLPNMAGSSSGNLSIDYVDQYIDDDIDEYSDLLRILDEGFLAFHNLGNLKSMKICGKENLRSFSFEGLSHLISLRSLEIKKCEDHNIWLLSCTALEKLSIKWCGSLTALERLQFLGRLTHLNIEACPGLANGRWLLPTSLRKLEIGNSDSHETLQPCFPTDSTSLESLVVWRSPRLQSIQLHSCTALEELTIRFCGSLTALEGLQCLGRLRHLYVSECPGLPPFLESFRPDYGICPRLERLEIDDPSVLTTSFCKHLTSLQHLVLSGLEKVKRLTDEQEQALVLHKSLKELRFFICSDLVDLPARLRDLPSLQRLKINLCRGISRLPVTGLPLSLEQLEITCCSKELADECSLLPPSKLNVKIDCCV